MTLMESAQQLSTGARIILFELDTTLIGGTDIYYFCSSVDYPNPIVFGGQVYTPVPIEATGFEWNGRGSIPQPHVKISNIGNLMTSVLVAYNDLLGAEVRRKRTFQQFLDDGSTPDSGALWPVDYFRVEQKLLMNKSEVELVLSSSIDQEGQQLPMRQVLRSCGRSYRIWDSVAGEFNYANATCPFIGGSMFDNQGNPTLDPTQDSCGFRLSDCELRFPGQALPTHAFPAVGAMQ